jgi:hypothetical protein
MPQHRLGFEPEPPDWDANTLPMSYLGSLYIGASFDLYILVIMLQNTKMEKIGHLASFFKL